MMCPHVQPDEGSYYTAWSSVSTLIKKGFVSKSSHPPRLVGSNVIGMMFLVLSCTVEYQH